jgi:hypothetical protein
MAMSSAETALETFILKFCIMKKLEKEQMEDVVGGISKEAYCAIAQQIIENNDIDAAVAGYVAYLCS